MVKQCATDFTTAWRALPHRGRFVRRMVIGLIACSALAAGLSLLGRAVLDSTREAALIHAAAHHLSFQQASFLSQPGSTACILPLALVAAWIAVRRRRPLHALALLSTALVTKAVVGAGWLVWPRERPDLIAGGIGAPSGLSSFPSGHVAQTVAFYGLLVWWWCARSGSAIERLLAWMLLAALVAVTCIARLAVGAHWPSDLVAGALVGGAWLVACAVALRVRS
jgi:undecaprenyl-diphosphatase